MPYRYERESTVTDTEDEINLDSPLHNKRLWSMLDGLAGISKKMGSNNSKVFGAILLSATIVLIARTFAPFEVGTDQSVQLEASQRLADGSGLTTTNEIRFHSFDISETPTPEYLTQWPPGFSILVAGFLFSGLPLLASLKIIYGITTVVGWVGWAIIASHLISGPIRVRSRAYHLNLVMAALLPIFTTPWWKGTDIFLWAGVPFFILLLLKSSGSRRPYTLVMIAGLLFGFCCAMRYAGAFLGLAAFLILFQVSYPDIKSFLKRVSAFLLPSLIIVFSIFIYIKLHSPAASALPSYFPVAPIGSFSIYDKIVSIIIRSPITSNLLLGFPLLEQIIFEIDSKSLNFAVGLLCLLAVFLLPIVVLRSRALKDQGSRPDIALSLSLLPVSLTVFLIAVRILTATSLFTVRRYYEPIILCGVFVFYEIATKRATYRAVKVASFLVVVSFMVYTLLFNLTLFFIPERREQVVKSVLSFSPANSPRQPSTSQNLTYPDWKLYSRKENSRLKVKQLYDSHPQSLFMIQEYSLYIYDKFQGGPVPGRDLIDFPGVDFLKRAYTSKPVKVFWVLEPKTDLYFIPESNFKLIFFDPIERTRIYESDFPAGCKFWAPTQPNL